jgi:hypothetical protein
MWLRNDQRERWKMKQSRIIIGIGMTLMFSLVASNAWATSGPAYKSGGRNCVEQAGTSKYKTRLDCLDTQNEGSFAPGWEFITPTTTEKWIPPAESLLVLASAKTTQKLTAMGVSVACGALTLPEENQRQLNGTTGKNSGTSKEVVEYTGCSVEGNGSGCEVASGKSLRTKPIVNTLAYSSATRTGPLLILLEPASGKVFASISFNPHEGGSCTMSTATVEGSVVGQAFAGGKPVEVGHNEVLTTKNELVFSSSKSLVAFVEREGVLRSVKPKLSIFGLSASIEGTTVEEAETMPWGLSTS